MNARTSMDVSGGDAAFAQFGQHGGVVDAQVLADSCQGPAEVVEVDGVVGLVGGEGAAAHWHAVPVENVADRSPFDAEPITQFVHRRAGLIAGDQLLDLIVAELPGTPGSVPLGRRRVGCVEAGELLQGPDLVFQVVISSPKGPPRSEAVSRSPGDGLCVAYSSKVPQSAVTQGSRIKPGALQWRSHRAPSSTVAPRGRQRWRTVENRGGRRRPDSLRTVCVRNVHHVVVEAALAGRDAQCVH